MAIDAPMMRLEDPGLEKLVIEVAEEKQEPPELVLPGLVLMGVQSVLGRERARSIIAEQLSEEDREEWENRFL